MKGLFGLAAACAVLAAAPTAAQTLTHSYDFDGSAVTDSVGGVNGTLLGGATVSGGFLQLDGIDDYVQLSSGILPTSGSWSLYVAFTGHNPQLGQYVEIFSQGTLYLGSVPGSGQIRISDVYSGGIGTVFPSDGLSHGMLLSFDGTNSRLYIDGGLVFTGGGLSTPSGNSRIGAQYGGWGEYFQGNIDSLRTWNGAVSWATATGSAVPEPGTWAMMIGGFGLIGAGMRRRKAVPAAA